MQKVLFVLILFFVFSGETLAEGASMDFFYDDSSSNTSSNDDSSSNASSNVDSSSNASSNVDSSSNASSSNASSNVDSSSNDNRNYDTSNNNAIVIQHTKTSCARNVKKPVFSRTTTPEYFSIYSGTIINQQSLNEFFNITNNQYRTTCNSWYRKYLNKQFHKALVFAYDKINIKDITSYWGFSYDSPNRREAEQNALAACETSSDKIKSHTCAILFSNNEIVNKDYLDLANN